jgi:hypothetical protein
VTEPERPDDTAVTPVVLRRLAMLSALPFVGFVLFAVGGVLAVVTFSHNGSPLECSGTFAPGTDGACGHHSYVPAIVLLVIGIVVLMGATPSNPAGTPDGRAAATSVHPAGSLTAM